MAIYVYKCGCGKEFELIVPMPGKSVVMCPFCKQQAKRKLAPCNHTFGWRLSDQSHLKGHADEFVRDL